MIGVIVVLGLIGFAVYSIGSEFSRKRNIEKEVLQNGSIADYIRRSYK